MKLPRYWARATAKETDQRGNQQWFSNWGWSNESEEDAYQKALAAARKNIQRMLNAPHELQRYPYGQLPLREEVIDRLTDTDGELIAAVTQNAYGSMVLNTSRVMFIDIDFPEVAVGIKLRYLFFPQQLRKDREDVTLQQEAAAWERVKLFHQAHSHWAIRAYRTAAGFRLLVTHELFDPAVTETRRLLEEAGSDPLYIRLCQAQECFRARLTPKPWRCGHYHDSGGWPFLDDANRLAHAQWQAEYEQKQAGFATCRYVETLGRKEIHPEVQTVLALHDRFTRCDQDLPLA